MSRGWGGGKREAKKIDLDVHVVGARGVAPRHARNGAQPLRRGTVGGVIGAQEHEAVGLLLDDDLWISKHLKGEPKVHQMG